MFFVKHEIYKNNASGRCLMSLGFRACACLGLPVVQHESDGQVTRLNDMGPWVNDLILMG